MTTTHVETPESAATPASPASAATPATTTGARRGGDSRRVLVALILASAVAVGVAVGDTFGGRLLVLLVLAVGGVVMVAAAVRPVLGVAIVPFAVGFGNAPIPGAPGGLQVVHAFIALAVGALVLHLLLADRPRVVRPDRDTAQVLGAVVVFVAASFLSGLVGLTPYLSTELNIVLLGAVLTTIATVLVTTSVAVLRGLLCVVVAASATATAPVLGQLQGVAAERGGTVVDNRPTGSLVDPNELGAFAVVALVLSLTLVATRGSRWWEILIGGVGTVFALLALVLSFSRGSWVAGIAAVAVMLCVASLRPRLLRGMLVLLGFGAVLYFTQVLPLPLDVVSDRASSLLNGSANPYDVRPFIWQIAVQGLVDAPMLGHGPGSFTRLAADDTGVLWAYPVVHAHSGPLTVAAENGVVGLLAALAVVLLVTRGLFRATRNLTVDPRLPGTAAGLLAALVGVGGALVVDYTLRNPLVLTTVWLVVGLAIAAARLGGPTAEAERREEVRS